MSEKEKEKTGYMGYLKSVSLVILTLQNTLIVLVGKAATIKSAPDKFLTCTVVTISEIAKFIVCSLFLLKRCESFSSFVKTFHEELFIKYRQTLKVSVPALLYVIQNNLLLVGIDNLPAAVFQVSTQLKILTTALMSVMLLRKKLSWSQWMALVFLFLGVILVNIKLDKKQNPTAISNKSDGNPLLGMTSVVVCALTSAFSGVYFEKLLKHEKFDLIVSNIQLSFVSIILAVVSGAVTSYEPIWNYGIFHGFNIYVWGYIFLLAFGGMVISLVIKYADNILKGFATSIAIIFSSILSYFFFSFEFTTFFQIGASLVILSVLIYSYG